MTETFEVKVDRYGDVRWRGYLDTSGDRRKTGRYPTCYEPDAVTRDAPRIPIVIHQGMADADWTVTVRGAAVYNCTHKNEAQCWVEGKYISNSWRFIEHVTEGS